ncbi:MAG TPA: hypothetical protein VFS43_31265 [Polyangiaceae bacterium]|nr:hypothetical protein [Polyangiaceae bacterium]
MDQKKTRDVPAQGGEAEYRKRNNERGGGQSLNTPLENDQLRGVDGDGQITTGTHGGPAKPQSANPNHPQHGRPEEEEDEP